MASRSLDTPLETPGRDRIVDALRSVLKNYTVRVVVQAIVTIWAVATLTFLLVREMPGNPIDVLIEQILAQEGISYQEAYDRVAAS
ncbi:MAG: ABC transporter permease, partial [Anaerolineae bacterium]|nr:ABC transporter permease [Anaerolineae bacterium]